MNNTAICLIQDKISFLISEVDVFVIPEHLSWFIPQKIPFLNIMILLKSRILSIQSVKVKSLLRANAKFIRRRSSLTINLVIYTENCDLSLNVLF